MTDTGRRDFFKQVLVAGAALAISGTGMFARSAVAAPEGIKGVCLYVPCLGKADEFVAMMNRSAPGDWTVHPMEGAMIDRYFAARNLFEEAKGHANTLVGVVDPASFAVIHEAIVDSVGSFHYVTYEDVNRVTFSVRV
jgi:hypothetical protein